MGYWRSIAPRSLTDNELVEDWLSMHRKSWFENPGNGLYGYEIRARHIAEYWLQHGEHGPDYGDINIIHPQKMWDEYIKMFEYVEAEEE